MSSLYDQEEDTRSLHTCFYFPLEFVLYVPEPPYTMQIRREASMAFRLGISPYVHMNVGPSQWVESVEKRGIYQEIETLINTSARTSCVGGPLYERLMIYLLYRNFAYGIW